MVLIRNVIFGLLAASWASAWATSFIERPIADTVADTPILIRGRVGGSYSDFGIGPDGVKRIYTIYDVNIREVIKGDAVPQGMIQVRELGGEKDGIGMQVAGAAHFEKGEDVVLTLAARNPDGSYDLRGLSSGKYAVRQDENGQEYIVGSGAPGPAAGGQSAPGVKNRMTLSALREIVKSQGGVPQGSTNVDEKPKVLSTLRPSTPPSSQPAPRLQPSSEVEPEGQSGLSSGAALAVALGLGAIGAGVFWVNRRR